MRRSSVVFLVCQSGDDENLLCDRTAFLARRLPWTFRVADPATFPVWAADRQNMPFDGVLWLSLRHMDDDSLTRCLHVLNHIRTRLAYPGGGCLILAGDSRLGYVAAREANDLWSIRSFVAIIDGSGETREAAAPAPPETSDILAGWQRGTWSPPSLTLPEAYSTPQTVTLVRSLSDVFGCLPDDLQGADQRLRQAVDGADPDDSLAGVLLGLAAIYVGGARKDADAVTEAVQRASSHTTALPVDRFRLELSWMIQSAGHLFGCQTEVEDVCAQAALKTARGLYEQLGTPEATRDLSISLDNVAGIARARGDLDQAETAYTESLTLLRGLYEQLGTPEATRDLSISLDNVAGIAQARGDLDQAETAYTESLTLARGLYEQLGTPEATRDLSVSLNNVAWVQDARNHVIKAAATRAEAQRLERLLADGKRQPVARPHA